MGGFPEKQFPVMNPQYIIRYKGVLNCPEAVPWEFVLPHNEQALTNHGQTLQRLAERGGLCPIELLAVVQDSKYTPMHPQAAVDALNKLLEAYENAT